MFTAIQLMLSLASRGRAGTITLNHSVLAGNSRIHGQIENSLERSYCENRLVLIHCKNVLFPRLSCLSHEQKSKMLGEDITVFFFFKTQTNKQTKLQQDKKRKKSEFSHRFGVFSNTILNFLLKLSNISYIDPLWPILCYFTTLWYSYWYSCKHIF